MKDLTELWGHNEALSCYWNPERRSTVMQWFHTDQPEMYDPNLTTYTPDSFDYRINSMGYRGPEFENIFEDPQDVILYVGCSFTFGVGCPYEHTWAYMLHEELCNRAGKKFQYINLGCGGTGEDYIIRTLSNWLELIKPVAVFIMFPEFGRSEIAYPKSEQLQRMGIGYPNPKAPKLGNILQNASLQSRWDTISSSYKTMNEDINLLLRWRQNVEHIRLLLKDIPWYWQTWDIESTQKMEYNTSLAYSIIDHKLPAMLTMLGKVVTNKNGYQDQYGSGRDHSHTGYRESLVFVNKNIDSITPFWK